MLLYYLLQRESHIIFLMCIWHLIIHFHTGNVYCGAVPTVFVSIFLTNQQPKNMKKKHPQLCFNSKHIGHLKYRWYPLLCNTPKTEYQFHATSTPPCLIFSASIKRNVRTLPTYRWHPLIYKKIILYCKTTTRIITKNILSWCKMKL